MDKNAAAKVLAAAGTGAAMAYLLDAQSGSRRRARLRDRGRHFLHKAGEALDALAADLSGRSQALMPAVKRIIKAGHVDDGVLSERVRSRMGRLVSHPRSVTVEVSNGIVTLRGPLLLRERDGLILGISRIPGVQGVVDRLDLHITRAGVPGLQSGHPARSNLGGTLPGAKPADVGGETGPGNEGASAIAFPWSPAARFAAIAFGSALALAYRRRGPLGLAVAGFGLGLCARGLFNRPLSVLLGLAGMENPVRLRKSINIDAPPHRVYEEWSRFANFPRLLPHVAEARDLGEGRSHWKVRVLLGATLSWDAEIMRREPDRALAWETLPGALIPNSGIVRFNPNGKGGTAVDIRFSYAPPAGELGHAFAKLLGADPKRKLDQDLLVMKEFLERSNRAR